MLLHNGRVKPVEAVRVGDALLGDDGAPRRVCALARGRERLARVALRPSGSAFACNVSHVLSLQCCALVRRCGRRVAFCTPLRRAGQRALAGLARHERVFRTHCASYFLFATRSRSDLLLL